MKGWILSVVFEKPVYTFTHISSEQENFYIQITELQAVAS